MKRVTWYALIDALAFVLVVFLAATGLLLRYVLPPGSGGLGSGGYGWRASERPVTLLWGLTRHEWGNIHFWIAMGLAVVLAAHLALHWRWIVCTVRGQSTQPGSGWRVALGLLGLLSLLLMAAVPFLSSKQVVPRDEWQEQRGIP